MKYILHTAMFLALIAILSACSATSQLTMGVKEPARVPIPSDVVRIGLINRSVPAEGNESLDKIDKILSLEGLRLDELGAQSALNGLKAELERSGRFESVSLIDGVDSVRKGLGVFPAQMSWDDIDAICDAHNVDVIFSLEFYDTDTNVGYEQKMVNIPNPLGIKAEVPGHRVTIRTALKNGWRVYDPHTKYILDESSFQDNLVSVGEGINPFKAVEAIAGRKEAVLQTSNNLGNAYGLNIRNLTRRVTRIYYVKGTDNFEIGQRRAQAGDWKGAAELWERELSHPDAKIAGRAFYNMAISNEIDGNLDRALEYASKSYTDYNNKDALRYVNILKYRKQQVRELDNQLSK
ncbi:hypothetical protein FGM00_06315 [Aggregatimonas sangjinii]|uniref:Tetratricopeptide repeat protein n=1 Tax=Aggregatimonas sangjinii TaxID=2583587 RepID=A0A5B7SRV4_9FLAO|nr:DUF6340 family protein [Aggregatimonas sangjinii]QCW99730.1 hypothetical protein FGM00_06315 [Aggregatimonas sangjinii]